MDRLEELRVLLLFAFQSNHILRLGLLDHRVNGTAKSTASSFDTLVLRRMVNEQDGRSQSPANSIDCLHKASHVSGTILITADHATWQGHGTPCGGSRTNSQATG